MSLNLKRTLIILILLLLSSFLLFFVLSHGKDWLYMGRLEFLKTYWRENVIIVFLYGILMYFYHKLGE